MDSLINFLSNPVLGGVGVVVAIIGLIAIPLSIWQARRANRTMEPRWSIRNSTLIDERTLVIPNLQVLYRYDWHGSPSGPAQEIKELSIAKIKFWNAGTHTIRHSDVDENDHFRIESKGPKILNATIIQNAYAEQNRLSLIPGEDGTYVDIDFSYLRPHWGCVISVVYVGTSENDITMRGTVPDGHDLKKIERREERVEARPVPKGIRITAAVVLGSFLVGAAVFSGISSGHEHTKSASHEDVFLAILLGLAGIVSIGVITFQEVIIPYLQRRQPAASFSAFDE